MGRTRNRTSRTNELRTNNSRAKRRPVGQEIICCPTGLLFRSGEPPLASLHGVRLRGTGLLLRLLGRIALEQQE